MKPDLGFLLWGLGAPLPVLIVCIGMTWEFMEINKNFGKSWPFTGKYP
jgi:hypothetical protein